MKLRLVEQTCGGCFKMGYCNSRKLLALLDAASEGWSKEVRNAVEYLVGVDCPHKSCGWGDTDETD